MWWQAWWAMVTLSSVITKNTSRKQTIWRSHEMWTRKTGSASWYTTQMQNIEGIANAATLGHIIKYIFGLFMFGPGVHFSFDVLPSWSDQGSCAHKCVCKISENRHKKCRKLPLNKHAMNIWFSSLRIRAHLSWRTGKHLHVLHLLRTYCTCSHPGW